MTGMTKAEREVLQRLIRQREKVLKSAATQRSLRVTDRNGGGGGDAP
jgi:hypothetical protein